MSARKNRKAQAPLDAIISPFGIHITHLHFSQRCVAINLYSKRKLIASYMFASQCTRGKTIFIFSASFPTNIKYGRCESGPLVTCRNIGHSRLPSTSISIFKKFCLLAYQRICTEFLQKIIPILFCCICSRIHSNQSTPPFVNNPCLILILQT